MMTTRQAPTGGLDDDKAGPLALAGMMTTRQAPTGGLDDEAGPAGGPDDKAGPHWRA